MKTIYLLLCLVFVFELRAAPVYSNIAGSFTGTCDVTPAGRVQSPILINESPCLPYNDFVISASQNIQTGAITSDANVGSLITNTNALKLTIDTISYTSQFITFRHTAEHTIYTNPTPADLEMQIVMTADGTSNLAVIAFPIRSTTNNGTIDKSRTFVYNKLNVIRSLTATNWDIRLQDLANAMNSKAANIVFLNLFTYQGTLTYPPCTSATWFVYGSELYTAQANVDALVSALQAATPALGLNGTFNARPSIPANNGVNGNGGGSQYVNKYCFTGYFEITMSQNYGLWFGVVIILLYFIITLMLEDKPIRNSEYVENIWTAHPIISIMAVGNEIFTRKSRASLLLMILTVHALFTSVWYRKLANPTNSSNIIVYAVYSMLISWFVVFMIGSRLRGYYVAKHQYYKTKEDRWEQKAQNRLFAFYFTIFVMVVVCWPFTVWNMGEVHSEIDPKISNLWVASFFVGLALEFLIADVIACLIATRVNFIRKILVGKAFFYDHICHETYMDYIKMD